MKRVEQLHNNGCFIACLAILLGKTYNDAYGLIHPKESIFDAYFRIGLTPEESLKRLSTWFKITPTKVRRIRDLRRDALLLLRWQTPPYTLMHGVVYDAKKKQLLDPGSLMLSIPAYERQIESVLYVESKNEKAKARHSRNNRVATQ